MTHTNYTWTDLDLLLLFISFIEAQEKHWQSMLSVVAELESVANMVRDQDLVSFMALTDHLR